MWQYLQQGIIEKLTSEQLAVATLAFVSVLGYGFLKWAFAKALVFRDFIVSRRRALGAVARTVGNDGPKEGPGVWTLLPITQPSNYKGDLKGASVLAVANLKGGVGKTTVTANIAAHLASNSRWRKKILLIDLDYQGSLSSMCFPIDASWLPPANTDSVATRALSGDLEPNLFLSAAKRVDNDFHLDVITAHYDLAQAENRLLVEWLLNASNPKSRGARKWLSDFILGRLYNPHEMRYNLAKLLCSDAVRDAYDLIIIDCPPRLTAGTIQALCASTHLLIPTILDKPSSESVISFCDQVESLRTAGLCPHLRHVGVVATRYVDNHIAARRAAQLIRDRFAGKPYSCGLLSKTTFIPQTQALVRDADEGIAYFSLGKDSSSMKAKSAIAALAEVVAHQVGVSPVASYDDSENIAQLNLPGAAE